MRGGVQEPLPVDTCIVPIGTQEAAGLYYRYLRKDYRVPVSTEQSPDFSRVNVGWNDGYEWYEDPRTKTWELQRSGGVIDKKVHPSKIDVIRLSVVNITSCHHCLVVLEVALDAQEVAKAEAQLAAIHTATAQEPVEEAQLIANQTVDSNEVQAEYFVVYHLFGRAHEPMRIVNSKLMPKDKCTTSDGKFLVTFIRSVYPVEVWCGSDWGQDHMHIDVSQAVIGKKLKDVDIFCMNYNANFPKMTGIRGDIRRAFNWATLRDKSGYYTNMNHKKDLHGYFQDYPIFNGNKSAALVYGVEPSDPSNTTNCWDFAQQFVLHFTPAAEPEPEPEPTPDGSS